MNSHLWNRSLGSIYPSQFQTAQCARLVHSLESSPGIRFSSGPVKPYNQNEAVDEEGGGDRNLSSEQDVWAHKAGVNVLTVDQYEKRYMLSGGADSSIHLWDIESRGPGLNHLHKSIASVSKATNSSAHTHTLTSISIYPFDPTPSTILTTSHDSSLKLSSLGGSDINPVHSFSLHSTPYSHSFSSHPSSLLLIGVGTSDKAVRLLDLRSGLSTHGLPGHTSAVLSVEWAPHNPYLIASASKDNRVIIFDVRRSGNHAALASLDMNDPTGVLAPLSAPSTSHARQPFVREARAHDGAVTGVRWTANGSHLLTAGQDSRIRVWDAFTGANTLVHFGPRTRNSASLHLAERAPLVLSEKGLMPPGHEVFLWPNYNDQDDRGEIFMFEYRNGTFVKQLRVPGLLSRQKLRGRPTALSAARINALAWRGNGASGEGMELFSAHGDGTIRTWTSKTEEDKILEAEEEEVEQEEKKRKRDVLEDVYRGLMQPSVKFT